MIRKFSCLVVALLGFAVQNTAVAQNCVSSPNGLVHWWPGDGTVSNAVSGAHASLQNGATFGAGKAGQGFAVSGGASINFGTSPGNFGTNSFTIEFWVKTSAKGPFLLSKRAACGNGNFWDSGIHGSSGVMRWEFDTGVGTGNFRHFDSTTVIADGNFHHVVLTRNGYTMVLYVDGVLDVTYTSDVNYNFDNTANFALGANPCSAPSFSGILDELSLYDKALTLDEVQSLYAAGVAGKCRGLVFTSVSPLPDAIVGSAYSHSITATGSQGPLTFSVLSGTLPTGLNLSANGLLSGTPTTPGTFDFTVQVANSNNVAVQKQFSLSVGSCNTPPIGMVAWWKGENDLFDQVGGNHAAANSSSSFVTGKVGTSINFDGISNSVVIPASSSLNVSNFTVEGWINPSAITGARPVWEWAAATGLVGPHLSIGDAGTGSLRINLRDTANGNHVTATAAGVLAVGQWHHVAVTYDVSTGLAQIIVNGAVAKATNLGVFTPKTGVAFNLGKRPSGSADYFGGAPFAGQMDEISVYDRALSTSEIAAIAAAGAAGKCLDVAASIAVQPQSHTVFLGQNLNLFVAAVGSGELSYQWHFNETNTIVGATNASLTITNVQLSHQGSYSVSVSNAFASVTSSNAFITVALPPSVLQIVNTSGMAGGGVTVPVELVANGSENALGFSINFPTNLLTYQSIVLGSGGSGTTLLLNTNQAASGRLGIAVAKNANETFTAGTQEIIHIAFGSKATANATTAPLTFGDVPTARQVSDSQAQSLIAFYTNGAVSLARTEYEADVAPRPGGNYGVSITDWVQVGRFVAGLDVLDSASEFQRADCAPKASLGDGKMRVTDWVQAGLYASGLDPLAAVGGPTVASQPVRAEAIALATEGNREVRLSPVKALQALPITVPIQLQAQGNENAVGFSLSFDATRMVYNGSAAGSDANGATLHVNTNQLASGKVGIAMALQIGTSFSAGLKEIAKVTFTPLASTTGVVSVTFDDQPVARSVSDSAANELTASFVSNGVVVHEIPALHIVNSGTNTVLTWPLGVEGFALQVSATNSVAPVIWTNVLVSPVTNGSDVSVTIPRTDDARFFRLRRP